MDKADVLNVITTMANNKFYGYKKLLDNLLSTDNTSFYNEFKNCKTFNDVIDIIEQ